MKPLSVLLLVFGAAGCTTVAPVEQYGHFINAEQPQKVWVTRTDQSTLEIGAPRIAGDTLFGFHGTKFQEIPLHTITQVKAVRPATARTAALALSLAVVAGAAYWKMNSNSSSSQSNCMGGEEDIC